MQNQCTIFEHQKRRAVQGGQEAEIDLAQPPPLPPLPFDMEAGTQVTLDAPISVSIPSNIRGLTVRQAFYNWHCDQYYLSTAKSRSSVTGTVYIVGRTQSKNYSELKLAVEFCTLFLTGSHVLELPPGEEHPTSAAAEPWRKSLTTAADGAWANILIFIKSHGTSSQKRTAATDKMGVAVFKKMMTKLDHTNWPAGPEGQTPFQPPDGELQMKSHADLVAHQNGVKKSAEKRAAKKTIREDAEAENASSNKRARTDDEDEDADL